MSLERRGGRRSRPGQLRLPDGEFWLGDESSGFPESVVCKLSKPSKRKNQERGVDLPGSSIRGKEDAGVTGS